jgi:dolichol-phosphate mannosyltransferase
VAWRAILVDDGSRDRSAALISAHAASDPRFTLVELSRNFGFQAALSAGLAAAAEADAVITMDGDLQDPPELVVELVSAWRAGGEIVERCVGVAPKPACAGWASTCFTPASDG